MCDIELLQLIIYIISLLIDIKRSDIFISTHKYDVNVYVNVSVVKRDAFPVRRNLRSTLRIFRGLGPGARG